MLNNQRVQLKIVENLTFIAAQMLPDSSTGEFCCVLLFMSGIITILGTPTWLTQLAVSFDISLV